jgi:hypothetical protein
MYFYGQSSSAFSDIDKLKTTIAIRQVVVIGILCFVYHCWTMIHVFCLLTCYTVHLKIFLVGEDQQAVSGSWKTLGAGLNLQR